jgi:hypothetical protein
MGVDLSPLNAYELTFRPTRSAYSFVVRPCGVVNDSICTDRTVNATVCQRKESVTETVYSVSRWNASAVTYYRDQGGLTQILKNGDLCGSNPRQTTIYYKCDRNATVPQLISVTEPATCQYSITILTNLTCVALPFCNFDGVNLLPMFNQGDLNYTQGNLRWYVHMCGTVSNQLCADDTSSRGSMVCQQRANGRNSIGLAAYDASTVHWQSVPRGNNASLLITASNGEYCAAIAARRTARLQLVCDPSLAPNASYIAGVYEVSMCVYEFTIMTSLTCSLFNVPSPSSSTGV